MKNFWICGLHTVNEAIKNPKRNVLEVICRPGSETEKLCSKYKIKFKHYQKNNENKILQKNIQIAHQSTFALVESFEKLDFQNITVSKYPNLLALENITDVRNIGSIVRTAFCFKLTGIIIEKKNFKSDSIETYKTASGAFEYVDIYSVSNLNQALNDLKNKNYFVYGLDSNNGKNFHEESISITGNIFVLGAEGQGLKDLTKKNCDYLIKINISDKIGSLNVSNACSSALGIFNYIIDKKKAQ